MKNLLWFLRKPVDERENDLYQKAYYQSFITFIILLVGGLILIGGFGVSSLSIDETLLIILVAFLASSLTGWMKIKNEELSEDADKTKTLPLYYLLLGILFLTIYTCFGIALLPIGTIFFLLSSFVVVNVMVLSYAWMTSKKIPTPARILLVAMVPNYLIAFNRSKNKNVIIKLLSTFLRGTFVQLALVIAVLIPVVLTTMICTNFTYNTTDTFEPVLHKGQLYIGKESTGSFTVNEYVALNNPEAKEGEINLTVAQIVATHDQKLTVRTEMGEKEIEQSEALYKLNTKEPWLVNVLDEHWKKQLGDTIIEL